MKLKTWETQSTNESLRFPLKSLSYFWNHFKNERNEQQAVLHLQPIITQTCEHQVSQEKQTQHYNIAITQKKEYKQITHLLCLYTDLNFLLHKHSQTQAVWTQITLPKKNFLNDGKTHKGNSMQCSETYPCTNIPILKLHSLDLNKKISPGM